jgi:hypothetical protein
VPDHPRPRDIVELVDAPIAERDVGEEQSAHRM